MIEDVQDLSSLSDRDLLEVLYKCAVKQDKRIDSLETWRTLITGGLLTLMFVVSTFGVWLLGRV